MTGLVTCAVIAAALVTLDVALVLRDVRKLRRRK